ncbi:MAG: hypothetical protein AAFP23_03330 [Pseudomonadota bacterium]
MSTMSVYREANGIVFGQVEDAYPGDGVTPWVLDTTFSNDVLVWTGARTAGQERSTLPDEAVLSYDFQLDTSDLYLFRMNSNQPSSSPSDADNDAWVRVLDATGTAVAPTLIARRAGASTDVTPSPVVGFEPDSWFKTYKFNGFSLNTFTIDANPREFGWALDPGSVYTLQIGGRDGLELDYWSFAQASLSQNEVASADPVAFFGDMTPIPLPATAPLLAGGLILCLLLKRMAPRQSV